jgi:thymidine kinase
MCKSMGHLKMIIGPMFSGKTSYLLNEISNHHNKDRLLVIKHSFDNRYSLTNNIISHDNEKHKCFQFTKLSNIFKSNINLDNYESIIIDEFQFFEDVYDTVTILVEEVGKNVILAGLDGDYQRLPFLNGDYLKLIPFADEVIKLKGVCYVCQKPSIFTKRIIESDQQILIGSDDAYKGVCREHY